ncbi:MAG: UDP-N-acetylmuramate dehydrogenase [Streptosporangiales bacterium]|nr:UDP-N-acetylmuramate dehydrogenase [Streptosporangiales bacterium]
MERVLEPYVRERVTLAPYTTLRLGGPARRFVEATSADEVVAAVTRADRAGEPVLVLGGGSNVVVADEGYPGTVVRVATRGVSVSRTEDGVLVRAQSGEEWEPFVARCVAEGLVGVECLSGIPGLLGATPIQNVGAYGQEISDTLVAVRVLDRRTGEVVTLNAAQCGFTYRSSVFKGSDRYVVLEVTLALGRGQLGSPIRYAELARVLGVEVGERVPLADARNAVFALRRSKGMVLDPADPDTRSVGSFFVNPVLTPERAAELERRAPGFPRFGERGGRVKVPAAWLIERAGFGKGYAKGRARISTKHTLALTNPDSATTAELVALAREVRAGVRDRFGVELTSEPVLVGLSL